MTITKSALKTAALAACALGIAGTAFPGHRVMARAAASAIPNAVPGHTVEMVAAAATVTSTVHYQAQIGLDCKGFSCSGDFPRPGRSRQLNITRITCFFEANAGSTFRFGAIDLIDSTSAVILGETVPVDASAPNFDSGVLFTLNRAIDLQIAASQHMRSYLDVSAGTVIDASCTATGTLSTLG